MPLTLFRRRSERYRGRASTPTFTWKQVWRASATRFQRTRLKPVYLFADHFYTRTEDGWPGEERQRKENQPPPGCSKIAKDVRRRRFRNVLKFRTSLEIVHSCRNTYPLEDITDDDFTLRDFCSNILTERDDS